MSRVTASRSDKQPDVLIILDGKGDTGEYGLLDNASKIAEELGRELVILNGTNNPDFDGRTYNPFIGCSVTQAKDLMMSLLDDDTVKKSSGSEHYKTMFEAYLISVLEIMELLGIKFSFSNILDCLNFEMIQADLLHMKDEELSNDEATQFSILFSEIEKNWEDSKASVTKLEIFRRGRGKAIFEGGSSKNWFNVSSIYDDNQILLVLIDEMSMPEYSQGLAKMVVQDVRNFTASRLNGKHKRDRQVRLVLDEFSAYASKTMLALLSRARSAGVTVYLSTQSMGDLSALGEDFQQAVIENIKKAFPDMDAKKTAVGSTIYAVKPGDGSAREQAASCQKVLGGWANIAKGYATKRYRSNLINWGMLPFIYPEDELPFANDDYIFIPGIRKAIEDKLTDIPAYVVGEEMKPITLKMGELTDDERKIILAGCLINYYKEA